MRYVFWLLLIAVTAGVLWYYRQRLALALRILAVVYPILLLVSFYQSGFDAERLVLMLVMIVIGLTVFIVNRLASGEG